MRRSGETGTVDAVGSRRDSEPRPAARLAGHLRVAVLSDAIPGRNGVGTYYDDLVAQLAPLVDEIRLVGPPREGESRKGGWSVPLPGDATQRLHIPSVRGLWRELRDFSPHVVLSATPGFYGFFGLAVARRFGAVPCVAYHTELEKLAQDYWTPLLARLSRGLLGYLDRWMFGRSEAVLVFNESLRDAVADRGADKIRVVGTPTPGDFLETPVTPPSERISRVAFVGRLAPEKGIDQVLEAVAHHPRLRFTILGDGPLRDEVETAAARHDNLEHGPWGPRERVLELLDGSDLLVLPSRHETFGTAAFEALTRQRLALVSPHCGILEWPELAAGLFVMADGERLHESLTRVLAVEPALRRKVALRGRKAALLQSARTVEQWLEVLAAAARTRRVGGRAGDGSDDDRTSDR